VLKGPGHDFYDEENTKPWKYKETWALSLLQWVFQSLDERNVEREWGFLVPPLLTILDDTDVQIRAKGCKMLQCLLEVTPPQLLKRTGLGPLFENSLYISTTYLPSLTPEDDSIMILEAALPALLTLLNSTCPPVPKGQTYDPVRTKALDKFLRKGILLSYIHAGEHARIAETLLNQLPPILKSMGIDSVKHFKDLIPLLVAVLIDPLGPACPDLLLAATKAMQAVVVNGWPRIGFWRGETLKGLTVCWLYVAEEGEENEEFAVLKKELRIVAQMLKAVLEREEGVEWDVEVRKLIDADLRLEGLFEIGHADK